MEIEEFPASVRGPSGLIRNRSLTSLDPPTSPISTLPIGCVRSASWLWPVSSLGPATVPCPPLRSVLCPPRGLPAGTRDWAWAVFFLQLAPPLRLGPDLGHLFAQHG